MSTPGTLQAVADLRRCLQTQDYAGAGRLIRLPATLDGLTALAAQAGEARAEADGARREAAEARLAEAERARVQAEIGPLLEELIGVLAEALGVPFAPLCVTCRRSLGRGRRNCRGCGTRDARAAEWPTPRRDAA